jgi:hypothetical protein
MSCRFFVVPNSREPESPATDQNLELSSKKIASIVLHSSLNIKFSIANPNNETRISPTQSRKTSRKCPNEFIYA